MTAASLDPVARRISTLDVLRAMAIALVVFRHADETWIATGLPLLDQYVNGFRGMGWIGVDLFFVLSGWLIGGLYFKEEAEFGTVDIRRFWMRRFLRTLPPYFVMLFALLAFDAVTGRPGRPDFHWYELVFLQNYLAWPYDYALTASWSLCIEEHFYLFLPLLLMATVRYRKWTLFAIPAIALAVALVRSGSALGNPLNSWDEYYTRTHFRVDNLLIGVWLAMVRYRYPALWQAIQARSRNIGVAGFLGLAAIWLFVDPLGTEAMRFTYFYTSVGFTALGVCFACLLIEATGKRSLFSHVPRWLATPIALSSYSMYLSHTEARELAHAVLSPFPVMSRVPGLWIVAYLVSVGIMAVAMYFLIEKPAIRLRDRWFPRRETAAVRSIVMPANVTKSAT